MSTKQTNGQRLAALRAAVLDAKELEKQKDLEPRNRAALKILNDPNARLVHYNGKSVETYYDRSERAFVTIKRDINGQQIAEADYSGNALTGAVSHLWALHELFQTNEEKLGLVVKWAREAAETTRAKIDGDEDALVPSWLPELERAIQSLDR